MIVGYDWQDQNSVNKNFANVLGSPGALQSFTQERINQDGVYLQNEFTLTDQIELVGGVRYDQVRFKVSDRLRSGGIDASGRRNFAQTTGLGGIRYSPVPWANFYLTVDRSKRRPRSEFRNPLTASGAGLNPGIQPQKSTNYEIGVKGAVGEIVLLRRGLVSSARYRRALAGTAPASPARAMIFLRPVFAMRARATTTDWKSAWPISRFAR
ncbi:MAG: TonB-dependent receptor [Nitrospira sp.]|nr:TonB-dependent receptor [Nitrospira sp.]